MALPRPLVPFAAFPGPFLVHTVSVHGQFAGWGLGSVSRHHDGRLSCRLPPGVLLTRLGLGLYEPDGPARLESYRCPAGSAARAVCSRLVSQSRGWRVATPVLGERLGRACRSPP